MLARWVERHAVLVKVENGDAIPPATARAVLALAQDERAVVEQAELVAHGPLVALHALGKLALRHLDLSRRVVFRSRQDEQRGLGDHMPGPRLLCAAETL